MTGIFLTLQKFYYKRLEYIKQLNLLLMSESKKSYEFDKNLILIERYIHN